MDSSPLAHLSPELRNIIWEYVFTTDYAVTLSDQRIFHPLTSICRQIRHETLSMYLSMTRFNAHLDDGPVTPVANWLTQIGPQKCQLLRGLSVWDLHMLNGTLHGSEATAQALELGEADFFRKRETLSNTEANVQTHEPDGTLVLRSVGREYYHWNWWLSELVIVFRLMGLGLARFCVVGGVMEWKETSEFAILSLEEARLLEG